MSKPNSDISGAPPAGVGGSFPKRDIPRLVESIQFPAGAGSFLQRDNSEIQSDLQKVKEFIVSFVDYKKKRLALVSSENHSSKLLRASYCLGLSDQYCSRLPQNRDVIDNLTFSNLSPLDNLNEMTREMTMRTFNAADCDIRLLSGLSGLNVLLFSLLDDKEVLFRMSDGHGGHLSTTPISRRLNINSYDMVLGEDYRLDMDHFAKLYRQAKPKVVFLDSSYILFPYPITRIREIVGPDTIIICDASHIIALVAAGLFQSPFGEGADIMHATTHKTLWGPQKSMILFKHKGLLSEKVHRTVEDLVSNTHIHHIFALYLALLEFKHFGTKYAEAIVRDAKYLADKLSTYGLNIVAGNYGYTESNQIWLDLGSKEEAINQFKKVDSLNISTNLIAIPRGHWGLRLALNSITRLGAPVEYLDDLARIFRDLLFDRKSTACLQEEVRILKNNLGEPKYSFDDSLLGEELIKLLVSLE
jgi:glycine hydroxymethyltransferase